MWSAIRSVWQWVRLLEVFDRVFGCFKCLAVCSAVSSVKPCVRPFSSVWPCVRLLRVFGRVFGCYNFLAVCSAVASVGRAFGRFMYWSVSVLLFSSCFYLYAFLPVSGFTHSFYFLRLLFTSWYLPFCLGMFLSRTRIFSRSLYSSIFYFCSSLFMYSLFLHILCVLILLCFGLDFCFLLFRSYSRGLFFPRRAFVLFCYSCGFSFLFYAMRFSSTSP